MGFGTPFSTPELPGSSSPFAPVISDPFATDSTRLARWRAAVANRAVAGPKAVMIADSWGEGTGATYQTRWVNRLVAMLRERYPSGVAGGDGYVPTQYNGGSGTLPGTWTYVGGASASAEVTAGLGLRYRLMSANSSATFVFNGTGADFHYGVSAVTYGGISYTVDGGAPVNISTPAVGAYASYVSQIRGLSAGQHTVVITVGNARACIEGMYVYNGDETLGFKVYEAAHGGYSAKNFANSPNWAKPLALIQPSLVGVCLGINDWGQSSANVRSTSAEMADALKSIVANIRANTPQAPSIFFGIQAKPTYGGTAPLESWETFRQTIRAVAKQDGKIAVYDAGLILGDITDAGTDIYGYRTDGYHVGPKGHQAYADGLFSILTRYP